MSLGDLVISLSVNTATMQSDLGKANQVFERVMASMIKDAKGAERAIEQLAKAGVGVTGMANQLGVASDRLQLSFNRLNLKSALQIEKEKAQIVTAFEQIKNSGVASANEIKRAHAAMQMQLDNVEGGTNRAAMAFNAFSLSGMMGLAKIQIAYQAVNALLSATFKIPKDAMQSVEDYNMSVTKTASLLTSFGAKKGVDIAELYKQSRDYALGLQDAMLEIDKHSVASTKQLQLMNLELQKAGIFLDPTKQSQVKGFTNISNALAVVASGQQNPDLQFSQEMRSVLSGEDKAGNVLLGILKSMDPEFEKHLKHWKQSNTELEEIGKLLIGFEAASGDIEALWSTISSTFESLYDEVIRDGMKVAFAGIVDSARQFNEWMHKNREVLSSGINKTLIAIKGIWDSLVTGVGSLYVGLKPIVWAISKMVEGFFFFTGVLLPTAIEKLGAVLRIGNALTNMGMAFGLILVDSVGQMAMAFGRVLKAMYQGITGDFKGAGETLGNVISDGFKSRVQGYADVIKGTIAVYKEETGSFFNGDSMWKRYDDFFAKAQKHKAGSPPSVNVAGKPEKAVTESVSNYNSIVEAFNQMQIKAEPDELAAKILDAEVKLTDLMVRYNAETVKNKELLNAQGISMQSIYNLQDEIVNKLKLDWWHKKEEAYWKAYYENAKTQAALRESEIQDKIALVGHEEAMNKISGPAATAQKIGLSQQLLASQKEYLGFLTAPGMESAWIAQQKQIVKTQQEIEKMNKLLYDRTAMGGFANFFKEMNESVTNTGAQVKNVMTNAFAGATDAILNFVETGKFAFADLTKAILKDIARIQIQKAIAGIANNIFAGFNLSSPQATSTWNGVSAGNAGAPAFQVPSFDVGTNYVPKDMLAMVHKGEKIVPEAYNRSSDTSNMKIEIINQSGQSVKGRDGGTKFDGKSFVKTIILEAMDTDYTFRNAVRG